jgi:hypothetical protein
MQKLTPLIDDEEEETTEEIKECTLPKKLEYIEKDEYLDKRGFVKRYYEEFRPAETKFFLERKLHDKFIFQFTMNGKLAAWLARSKKSKEWHEENLKRFKEGMEKLVLRYENSRDGFSHVIGGYDNITNETDTVIIVEGMFDYISVDTKLHLYESPDIKCVFTFGNNMGLSQIRLLRDKPGIRNVILCPPTGSRSGYRLPADTYSLVASWLLSQAQKRGAGCGAPHSGYLARSDCSPFFV